MLTLTERNNVTGNTCVNARQGDRGCLFCRFQSHRTRWQRVALPTPGPQTKWQGVARFRLWIEQDNKLSFDNIDPQEKRRGDILLGLNKASAFWQYQSQ